MQEFVQHVTNGTAAAVLAMSCWEIIRRVREQMRGRSLHGILAIVIAMLSAVKAGQVMKKQNAPADQVMEDLGHLLTHIALVVPTALLLASFSHQVKLLEGVEDLNLKSIVLSMEAMAKLPELMESNDVQMLAMALDTLAHQISMNPNIQVDQAAMRVVNGQLLKIGSTLGRYSSAFPSVPQLAPELAPEHPNGGLAADLLDDAMVEYGDGNIK